MAVVEVGSFEWRLMHPDSSPWTTALKREAAGFYYQQTQENPELVAVLSEREQWMVRDYLGLSGNEMPSQETMGDRLGRSPGKIGFGTRFALLKLIRAKDGRWPPPRETREITVPEVFVTGPGPTSDGTGEIPEEYRERVEWGRRVLGGG